MRLALLLLTSLCAVVRSLGREPPAKHPPLAITHVTVIDVESGRQLPDRTVVIDHDTIASVGPAVSVRLPNGTRVVDGRGKFLIPGLIDTHVHLALQRSGERDSLRALGAYLAHGVTGVREAGTGRPRAVASGAARHEQGQCFAANLRVGAVSRAMR